MIAAVGCGPRAPGFGLASTVPSFSVWADFLFVGHVTVACDGRNPATLGRQCAKGPPTECRRVAPGPLLVGVARKHVKTLGFWAVDFLFAPNRMQIRADLRHRVFEGVAKMRRRGL